jgi:hypothetical protein
MKRIILDFGMKEPDFITAEQVKQYAEPKQLTPKLKSVHRKLKIISRRYNQTELIVKDLTSEERLLLRRRGFDVKCYTKMKKGKTIFKHNHHVITAK